MVWHMQAVSMLMWSHAQLRRQPYAVLTSAVIKHAEECTEAYSMQGSTNLVWALHTLMPTVPAIPRATTQRMASTLTSHGANVLRLVVCLSLLQTSSKAACVISEDFDCLEFVVSFTYAIVLSLWTRGLGCSCSACEDVMQP